MRYLALALLLLFQLRMYAQDPVDSTNLVSPNPETGIETSYTGSEILLMGLAALAVLIAAYFLYRRRKRAAGR